MVRKQNEDSVLAMYSGSTLDKVCLWKQKLMHVHAQFYVPYEVIGQVINKMGFSLTNGTVDHVMSLLATKFVNLEAKVIIANIRKSSGFSTCASIRTMDFFLKNEHDNLSCVTTVWRFLFAVQVGEKKEVCASCQKYPAQRM